jgi:hypothetical protein
MCQNIIHKRERDIVIYIRPDQQILSKFPHWKDIYKGYFQKISLRQEYTKKNRIDLVDCNIGKLEDDW